MMKRKNMKDENILQDTHTQRFIIYTLCIHSFIKALYTYMVIYTLLQPQFPGLSKQDPQKYTHNKHTNIGN